jgi:MFS family permease
LSPFTLSNIRLFILFRVLFNARFYYPVFTVLFLDYGLTIEQFALLNTVWAFTIVLAEVPLGVVADIIGRKRLLVGTSLLMVSEMSLIAFVPLGSISLVFWAFFINRVLSGLAEAMASGADEAMAYDTLVEAGMRDQWSRVLDVQMRAQNVGYIFAMTVGAVLYDPGMVNWFFQVMGSSVVFSQQITMRFPVYLTLVLGALALVVTMKMQDPLQEEECSEHDCDVSIIGMTKRTLAAGKWIVQTPMALAIILFAMSFDHILRMLVTMTSQYYRLIQIPEALFGVLGSAVAVFGLIVPRIARAMTDYFTPAQNTLWVAGLSFVSLIGLVFFIPYLGLVPMMMVFVGMMLTSFFTSYYLNNITSSSQRATVLSFKGLAFNLAYGFIGIFYALLIQFLRMEKREAFPEGAAQLIENEAFKSSIAWFPWYLAAVLVIICFLILPRLKKSEMKNMG